MPTSMPKSMPAPGDREGVAELKRLAHEVRNAMNGVAVSLEVARSRAGRGAAPGEVYPFLETASEQLELATRLHKQYTDFATTLATDGEARAARRTPIHDAPEA